MFGRVPSDVTNFCWSAFHTNTFPETIASWSYRTSELFNNESLTLTHSSASASHVRMSPAASESSSIFILGSAIGTNVDVSALYTSPWPSAIPVKSTSSLFCRESIVGYQTSASSSNMRILPFTGGFVKSVLRKVPADFLKSPAASSQTSTAPS